MFSIYADMTDAERQVAGYLTNLGLYWIYQSPVFLYDEKKRPRVWSPDFYIPKLGIYIEVCGSKRFNYKYRERIYLDNNIPVVFLHYYKMQEKWQVFMVKRIKEIEIRRHFDAMRILDKINI